MQPPPIAGANCRPSRRRPPKPAARRPSSVLLRHLPVQRTCGRKPLLVQSGKGARARSPVERGEFIMKVMRLAAAAALVALTCGTAAAQSALRIGLAEDPDVLDPSLARTYVGRIVFASICDKLFDIDEKLAIVPQLALSHETSADGKAVTIKLRPGVKFHDGEAFDAAAAKYSLDRHLTIKGSFRKPELGSVEKVDVVDPMTI